MKKRTLKNVFDGFRSSVAQPSARTEHVTIVETLKPEFFQVAKTVRHGFPFQPTAMAFDPIQKVLAVGTKHGSIRLIGRPGVDMHVRHESEASVLFLLFLINEGALVSATSDSSIHMWNYRQKKPEVIHSIKFQRERITSICLPFQSKWLYVGSERGNVHVVNIETFTLSGYIINWNKAIDLSRKTHPGAVVHLSDCPVDPGKLLIAFETGQLVVWDLKTRTADCRYQTAEPLRSVSWHHEGKQFMCSHTDGSLTTWIVKQPGPKATSTIFPHAKTNKEGKTEACKSIQKVEWTSSRLGESFIIFSGGLTNNHAGRTPSITVIHGKTTTVLEMEHNVVDFITLCESPYPSDFGDPYALVVLLHNDLVVVDLLSQGYPCFENPYSMDLHESPVTCCTYLADCPADLIPAFYSVGARAHKTGFSSREWPICGGEWGSTSCSYPELIITGHADGSLKFWDSSSVSLQVLYKLKTAKVFEKDKSRSAEDDDPFAIQHISLCPESRLLCVAGASSHLILYKYCKQETVAEVTCLEIPIVYEAYDTGDYSPECEFPPRPNLQQASLDYFVNIHVRGGVQKKPPGYQAELVCLTPWVNGEQPGQITSVSINSSYGLIAYGNENGLVIVDYIQNTCLLNMGTPELYGAADPYQRVPRSPKKADSKDKDDDRDRSPSSDQDAKDSCRGSTAAGGDEADCGGGSGSREELLASFRPMRRMDSRGRGELDIHKCMIGKYNKVRDEHSSTSTNTSAKHNETKIDIIKFLTRKESKAKGLSKEERVKEYEERAAEPEEGSAMPDNFKKCHVKEGKGSEDEIDFPRCESDDLLLVKEDNTPLEVIPAEEASNTVQVTVETVSDDQDMDADKIANQERKMSRFRLKDTFTKFDAKVRRAFSWETSTSLDGPASEFYDDTSMVVVGNDGEVRETTLTDVLETEVDEAEDALETLDQPPTNSASTTTSEGGSPVTSGPDTSNSASDDTQRASPDASPKEETTRDLPSSQHASLDEDVERRGSGNRSSLLLFDEHGKPVPPPRRNQTLTEPKSSSRKSSDERDRSNSNLTSSSGGTHSVSVSPNEKRKASKPSVNLNVGEARTFANEACGESAKSDSGGSMPHTPSGPHHTHGHGAASSSGMTSPTSLGAFKTFMNTITKKGSTHGLHDKLDGSFSRSRSSSISSLENISSEAIQCLAFADSYVKKNDAQMLPTLWVGTSLGSVIQVIVSIPSAETRLTNPVSVFPSGTIFRLKGSILAMCFLDWNGALIKYNFESWRDAQKEKKDRTPTKSASVQSSGSGGSGTPNNRLSPTNSAAGESQLQQQNCVDRQFIVFCSEKVARVVALPSQNCVYKQIITEVSFVVKAEIIQMKDAVCLVCYVATGHISIFNLPSLRQLTYVDFLPLVDLRIARTFCFTNHGHGMYLCSPSEVQKFTLSADICKDLQELLGELFLPVEMPEAPKQSFFKGLFGGGVSQLDREELFGEQSGKPASSVAKHIPGPQQQMEMMNARAGSAASEISRARMAAVERGQRLGELDEKTAKMMNEAESFSTTARQLMLKYKDKKWYQL